MQALLQCVYESCPDGGVLAWVQMPLKKALLRERKERERAAGEAVLAVTRAKQVRSADDQSIEWNLLVVYSTCLFLRIF